MEEIELQNTLREFIKIYTKDFPQILGLNLMVVLKTYFRGRFDIDQFIEVQKEYMKEIDRLS
jgi:hypothetical protein